MYNCQLGLLRGCIAQHLINIHIWASFRRRDWLEKKPVAREWADEIACQSPKGRDLSSPDICKTPFHTLSVAVTRAKGLYEISYSNQPPARDGRSVQFEQMEEDSTEQMKPLLTTVSIKLFVVVSSDLSCFRSLERFCARSFQRKERVKDEGNGCGLV